MSHDGFLIGTTVCSCVSLLLLIISLSSDYWAGNTYKRMGLWQICFGSMCFRYEHEVEDFIQATRAFMLMGMLVGAASVFGLCALFFRDHLGSVSLKKLSTIASFIAGFFVLIAMVSFTGVFNWVYWGSAKYDWTFAFGWISCLLFLITGCLCLKMYRDEKY